jgi:broad specificity phosphatase PhoE
MMYRSKGERIMTSQQFYQTGLAALQGLSLDSFSHEDLVEMVAGRLLKLSTVEDGITEEEIAEDCERAARICCELAFHPQGVSLNEKAVFKVIHALQQTLEDSITFGKYKGKTFQEILEIQPSYILWLQEEKIIKFSQEILERAENEENFRMPPEDFYWTSDK